MVGPASPELDRTLSRMSVFFSLLAAASVFTPWFSETRYIQIGVSPSTSHWWLWQAVGSTADARLTVPLMMAVILLAANLLIALLTIRHRRVCLLHIAVAALIECVVGFAYIGVMLGPGATRASVGFYVAGVALYVVLICDSTRLWDWTALLPNDDASA